MKNDCIVEAMIEKNAKILLIEDENNIREIVHSYLSAQNYEVKSIEDGQKGLQCFYQEHFDCVLLDLMLPRLSGEEIIEEIRKSSMVPIIIFSAKVDEDSIVNGLHKGANDYLRKPFGLKELHARIQGVLKTKSIQYSFNQADLMVDTKLKQVKKNNHIIHLTPIEYQLLLCFIQNADQVLSRNELIDYTLGLDFNGYDRTIDVHIKNLRKKIEDSTQNPIYIKTIHGLGYRFNGNS
mgnify:CR=1 FL=1